MDWLHTSRNIPFTSPLANLTFPTLTRKSKPILKTVPSTVTVLCDPAVPDAVLRDCRVGTHGKFNCAISCSKAAGVLTVTSVLLQCCGLTVTFLPVLAAIGVCGGFVDSESACVTTSACIDANGSSNDTYVLSPVVSVYIERSMCWIIGVCFEVKRYERRLSDHGPTSFPARLRMIFCFTKSRPVVDEFVQRARLGGG